jgi:protocatechuate 4,5-dioxygenase beta chain
MVAHPVPTLIPRLDIPIVPIFMNEYFPPLPTAERCYNLGRALAQVLAERSERVAIYASGGLSHDPSGPRAGWIDEPLDRWFLERLERNDGEAIQHLFTFDSDTLRGGTGEIRAWITVAGTMQRRATVVDYIRAHHSKVGLAFAYWPGVETAETGWAAAEAMMQERYEEV